MAASNIWTPPPDFTDGEAVLSTKGNQVWRDNEQYLHQKDEFGYNSTGTDGSSFTTVASDIIIVTAVVPTGHDRVIWHEAMVHLDSDVADSGVLLTLIDTTGGGSTTLGKFFYPLEGNADTPTTCYCALRQANPGAGTFTYKITGVRNFGTGNLQRRGASDIINWYKVRGG